MSQSGREIRAIVVDDSVLMRQLIKQLLESDPEIEVVATAMDPYVAREKIKAYKPDVITLDIEMPRMDGLTFLKNLMRLHPIPTVMISTLTEKGARETMRALELGAFDAIAKPTSDVEKGLEAAAEHIINVVKAAARTKVHLLAPRAHGSHDEEHEAGKPDENSPRSQQVVAIGASTGGTEAIKAVLRDLDPKMPGIVIAQHIPPVFSASFAERMHQCTPFNVCEARDGMPIQDGHVYVAPGGRHLDVKKNGSGYLCRVHDSDPVNRHRPSVDVLFESVSRNVGSDAFGVILTGMGADGARGLKEMRDAGAPTIAQNEETSVVWGMPGSAVKQGAAEHVLPLNEIASKIRSTFS